MFDDHRRAEIRTASENLQSDLMYQMSLGSMELFHSNFLAWLFDQVNGAAESLLAPWASEDLGVKGSGPTLREYKSLDLVAYLPSRGPVVIENKVFGPLDSRQLAKYDATDIPLSSGEATSPVALVSKCHRIALTLLEPSSQMSHDGWRLLRYERLLDWLDDSVIDAITDDFEKQLVVRYGQLLTLLIDFRDSFSVRNDEEPVALSDEIQVGSQNLRLRDISSKVRMASVIEYLTQTIAPSSVVKYHFGFTNRSSLVECFFTTPFKDHAVGWQYQGGRLKIVVRLSDPEGRSFKGKRPAREKFVERHFQSGWFDDVDLGELLGGERGSGVFAPLGGTAKSSGKKYLDYEPDFVYRYIPAPDLTVGQLKAINQFLRDKAVSTKWE